MNPLELTTAEGKTLSLSQKKTLERMKSLGALSLEYNDLRATITQVNPFSGVEVRLTPLASAIADIIIASNAPNLIGLSDWNNLRMIFRLCWPDEYYKLID